MRFLGHVVSASRVSVDLEKVEAVMSGKDQSQSSRYVVSWDWLGITGDSRMGRSFPFGAGSVRPEKFQFLEKGQNRNFDYKIVISVKNP